MTFKSPFSFAASRWNQAAQPGDGVEDFYPLISAYDRLAIEYGYRDFGDAQATQAGLDTLIERSRTDRTLRWGAAEMASESRQGNDPRLQRENTATTTLEYLAWHCGHDYPRLGHDFLSNL